MHGEAWQRIGFLRDVMEESVASGFDPTDPKMGFPWNRISGASDGDTTIIYFGEHQPIIWAAGLPQDDRNYQVELIDTWNMTVTPAKIVSAPENHPTRHGSHFRPRKPDAAFAVELPGKPHLAIRIRPVGAAQPEKI